MTACADHIGEAMAQASGNALKTPHNTFGILDRVRQSAINRRIPEGSRGDGDDDCGGR
jgi:hypothetical protein